MSTENNAVNAILDQGSNFDPDTVPGFDKDDPKFKGLTPADIRDVLLREAEIQDYHNEEAASMEAEDRRREDREDD